MKLFTNNECVFVNKMLSLVLIYCHREGANVMVLKEYMFVYNAAFYLNDMTCTEYSIECKMHLKYISCLKMSGIGLSRYI